MPIFNLGYRHWKGPLSASWQRWWPITRTGIALAWKNRGLRLWLIFSSLPLFYFAGGFWGIGYLSEHKNAVGQVGQDFLRTFGGPLAKMFFENPDQLRATLWAVMFDWYFRLTQPFFFMVLVAMVGATLIARDVRTKAYSVYFSKPISLWHYLFGKGVVVAAFVALVTLVPALLLYGVAVAFSPNYAVIGQTWTLLPKIALCFLAIAVPSTLLMLFLSARSTHALFAVFIWIVLWLMGELMFQSLHNVPTLREKSWPLMFSFTANLRVVCHHILDVPHLLRALSDQGGDSEFWAKKLIDPHRLGPSVWYLVIVSATCLFGIVRKLSNLLKA